MVRPAEPQQPWVERDQEVVQWTGEATEMSALEKRQNGILITLAFPPVVISVGLDSNGLPAFTVTLADATTTTPATVATTNQTPLATATPAPAQTTQATNPQNTAETAPPATATAVIPPSTGTTPLDTASLPSETLVNSSPEIEPAGSNTVSPGNVGTGGIVAPSGTSSLTGSTGTDKITSTPKLQTTTEIIFAGGSAHTSIVTMAPSETAAAQKGTSPPVIAGAVVGAVGGTAAILLLIVLFLRWRRHRNDSKRNSHGSESIKALHTGPAPIMPHNSARFTTSIPPAQPDNSTRAAFLPAGAAGWLNRLSGSHLRAESPLHQDTARELDPESSGHSSQNVAEQQVHAPPPAAATQDSTGQIPFLPVGASGWLNRNSTTPVDRDTDGQGLQKTSDGKAPWQFPTDEAGQTTTKPSDPDAILPAPGTAFTHGRDPSAASSNYTLDNNPEWFNGIHGSSGVVEDAAARPATPVSPISPVEPHFDRGDHAVGLSNAPSSAQPNFSNGGSEGPAMAFVPPMFANGSSANTSPEEREHNQVQEYDFASRPDDVLGPSPARTPEIRETPPSIAVPGAIYNTPWRPPLNPHPPDPDPSDQQSWYTPNSPHPVAGSSDQSMSWPKPPEIDWSRPRVRPKGI